MGNAPNYFQGTVVNRIMLLILKNFVIDLSLRKLFQKKRACDTKEAGGGTEQGSQIQLIMSSNVEHCMSAFVFVDATPLLIWPFPAFVKCLPNEESLCKSTSRRSPSNFHNYVIADVFALLRMLLPLSSFPLCP